MIQQLRRSDRLNETTFLVTASILCLAISVFRVFYSNSVSYLFLNWNLFLAFVPWALTSAVQLSPSLKSKKATLPLILFSWLLFFPNAPYILTDLFHLRWESSMPIWFDLILILSFAWIGLLYGFFSLWDIERMMAKRYSPKTINIISSILLFVSSFGIYLGRYLRWNSWDLFNNPFGIIVDISDRVIHPFDHPRTWGLTLFMGVFLNLVYWAMKLIRSRRTIG